MCTDNTVGVNSAANTDTLSAGQLWPASATNNNYVDMEQASTLYESCLNVSISIMSSGPLHYADHMSEISERTRRLMPWLMPCEGP